MNPFTKPLAPPGQGVVLFLALCGGSLFASPGSLFAQENRDGMFITVPNPIDDKAVSQIERKVQEALEKQKRTIKIIVFNFNPKGQPSGTSDWNSPNRLAEFIRHLQRGTVPGKNYPHIATAAFIQNQVTKHT